MKPLNLTTAGYVEEVILDVFDEDNRFTRQILRERIDGAQI